jgi:hypothetical protein
MFAAVLDRPIQGKNGRHKRMPEIVTKAALTRILTHRSFPILDSV